MRERLAALYEDDRLASYLFIARFSRFARDKDGSNIACFDHIKYDGRLAADHCWLHRSKAMKRLDLQSGDWVEFEAQIGRYARTGTFYRVDEIVWDYELIKARNLKVIERAKG